MSHHETLGVPPTATPEEIKKAYRAKVMENHPDRNPGDAEAVKRFLAVQDAYDALTDPNYRPHNQGCRQTYQTKPPPRSKDDWIRDAPPPTHDIWGNPIGPNGEFVDAARYYKPEPRRWPVRTVAKPEPEVDLWKPMETKVDIFARKYWKEYNRLKIAMAYEEPDKFWVALDEWVKKNK